jgi:hypothetical protein
MIAQMIEKSSLVGVSATSKEVKESLGSSQGETTHQLI